MLLHDLIYFVLVYSCWVVKRSKSKKRASPSRRDQIRWCFEKPTTSKLSSTRSLLLANLAESTERPERLVAAAALEHNLRRRTNEEHPALADLLALGSHTDESLALGADDDAGTFDAFEGDFRARGVEVCFHDGEFFDWWVVELHAGVGAVGGGVEFAVGEVGGGHFLLGDGREVVGEHAGEGGDVFEFGREAGADDVVGGGHAFHDVCVMFVNKIGGMIGSAGYVPPLM